MEPLYEVIITEELALGVRLNDEADEKTFMSFLEEFVKPEPEGTTCCSRFECYFFIFLIIRN
jgi:hypothetical protein